jgi:hypothetical protein
VKGPIRLEPFHESLLAIIKEAPFLITLAGSVIVGLALFLWRR